MTTDLAKTSVSEVETLDRADGFDECWLLMAGVSVDEAAERAEWARDRIERYPIAARLARWFLVSAIIWLGPLLFLRTLARATSLDGDAFSTLMRRLREHRWTSIRLATLPAVAPLMEVLEEDAPPQIPKHPLADRPFADEAADHYDLIVVGSGVGGAPVATRMAEAGADVAIIEKGGLVEPETTSRALERYYVNQGMLGVARGTPIVVMAGSTVGGTTTVNSGTSLRPKTECLSEWDATLGTDFSDGALDPWLDAAEEDLHVMVPPDQLRSTSADTVVEGLDALGRSDWYGLPRNVDGCQGSGRCCFGCPTGAKQSTDRSFLPDALDAGADLLAGWEATAIAETDGHIRVDIESEEAQRRITADRLVLAAGAIYTPGLIRRHRLGSRWLNTGSHFKTHPATKAFGYFPDIDRPTSFPGIPQGLGYRPPEIERVTMEGAELPTCAVGPMIPAGGDRFRRWIGRHHQMVSYGAMVRDRNTGRVREPFGQPVISYDMHPSDARDLVRAMKLVGEVFFAAGAERVLLPFPGRDNAVTSPDALEALDPGDIPPDQLLMSGFHPQGTAGMGRIVDADLQLRGTDRVWVCDASVLPDSPGVNPQVTIAALSLRLADHLQSV